jgi:hypothetical protein
MFLDAPNASPGRIRVAVKANAAIFDRAGPDCLDFGIVPVGSSRTLSLDIPNFSDEIRTITLGTDEGAFSVEPASIEIAPGGLARASVTFRPQERGGYSGRLAFQGGAACPDRVALLPHCLRGVAGIQDFEMRRHRWTSPERPASSAGTSP